MTRHDEFQNQVLQLAHSLGWSHLHVRKSIGRGHRWTTTTNIIGWPDLLLWSPRQPGRHIALELKIPPDKLTDTQYTTLGELAAAGFETLWVTPDDLEQLAILLSPRHTRHTGPRC